MVEYIKKRDGRIVKFDRSRIENAVRKAFLDANNGYDENDVKKVTRAVLYRITQLYGEDDIPSVEEINDIVEITLMKHGYYDVAKKFIMYRKKKEDERKEKMRIWGLKEWVDDPVLKKFSINALRVLASRYPIKDENGNIVELPSEIFRRVAVGVAIAEMLYDKKVFDKNGGHRARYPEVFEGEELEKLGVEIFGYKLNRYMWERLYERFKELADEGKMKVSWEQFVELVKDGKITKNAEKYAKEWYELMVNQYMMPNTPTISNAGRPFYMLSACFVNYLEDSLEGIMKTAHDIAIISKYGGGNGVDLTVLRPEGDKVSKTSGVSSGPVSFLHMFDAISNVIKEGGIRRSAGMAVMQYWHPDIDKFIYAKKDNDGKSVLTTFNISVGLWEEFWEKLEKGEEFELINPRDGSVWGKKDARKFFEELAYMAWAKADPGVLYFDRHNQYNIMREKWGDITATNPCLTGDALVVTPAGLKRMDELREGDMVYVGNGKFEKIVKFYDLGEQDVYRIVTRMGFEIKATGDHRFMTSRGVKRVDEMKVDDTVFVWMNWKRQEYGVGEFVPDVIVKIEYVGKERVYDFETDGNKWFFANGIYNLDCGEEALYPYEACNLLSINLWKFVKEDENGNKYFDWDEYAKVIKSAVRMLDDVIEVNKYPLPEINEMVKKTRRVGLGFMGIAEALFELGIPYNSKEAYDLMKKWAETNQYFAMVESVELAKERGEFPAFEESGYVRGELPVAGYYEVPREEWNYDWDGLVEEIKKHGIRNAFLTTAPPTGSVSMIADTSSGIEPQFALAYKKSVTIGEFYYIDPVFERVLKERGIYSDDLIKKIVDNGGSVQGIEEVPEDIRRVFVTAMDIHWMDHILAQAVFQLWTDVSISKTINMPENATVEDVKAAYLMGHYLGLKGVTVYRMNSLTYQVLSTEKNKRKEPEMSDYAKETFERILNEHEWLKSYINLEEISGYKLKQKNGGLFLNVGFEFPRKEPTPQQGIDLSKVGELIEKYAKSGESIVDDDVFKAIDEELRKKGLLGTAYCPICWEKDRVLSPVVFEAGCKTCKRCGWSACTVA